VIAVEPFDPRSLERPHKALWTLYVLQALCTTVFFPIFLVPLYFRYHTLRYKLDDEGISASWGILFRREVYLTYRRIQDIHVSRNLFERWLGIAKVELQTAAGSASAELTLEGMQRYEEVRDWLYSRMRGTSEAHVAPAQPAATPAAPRDAGAAPSGLGGREAEVISLLGDIRRELEAARAALERRS
jgi:putative membrane protein